MNGHEFSPCSCGGCGVQRGAEALEVLGANALANAQGEEGGKGSPASISFGITVYLVISTKVLTSQ